MDRWMKEWMDEWMNEWINEWMNEWTNVDRQLTGYSRFASWQAVWQIYQRKWKYFTFREMNLIVTL